MRVEHRPSELEKRTETSEMTFLWKIKNCSVVGFIEEYTNIPEGNRELSIGPFCMRSRVTRMKINVMENPERDEKIACDEVFTAKCLNTVTAEE